ncbi:MAG: hypothetical protein R2743_26210 [Ilumatobacteraceae bacterium]
MTVDELAALRAENTELRRRVDLAASELAALRAESLARRAEVRNAGRGLPQR